MTRSPSRRKPTTRALEATAAPNCAAVRATVSVWRASSTFASWYWIAPTSASLRSAGAILQRAPARQVAMARQPLVPAERVIQRHPRADVRALPVRGQRQQEGDRPDEMRREPVEQQPALGQRLAHQPEVALLQIPQPAVDELARAAGGAGREVARLHERDVQPARGGVERATGPRRTAADHHHVEDLVAQARERRAALVGAELAAIVHERAPSGAARSGYSSPLRSAAAGRHDRRIHRIMGVN